MDFLLTESVVPYLPLYIDDHETFVIVDVEDYHWAKRWRWMPKLSRARGFLPRKIYAYRAANDIFRKCRTSIYLHKEICFRAYGPPPTPRHHIADHKFGNSLDCRRSMLRWATGSENRYNLNGASFRQGDLYESR